jgi:hypothetical protein
MYASACALQFSANLCQAHGPGTSESNSRLCHYLPIVQEQIDLAIGTIMTWNAVLAILALGVSCAGSWHLWEVAYVEKKATKHKRRRKQRKNSIPWDKIKVSIRLCCTLCAPCCSKSVFKAAVSLHCCNVAHGFATLAPSKDTGLCPQRSYGTGQLPVIGTVCQTVCV